MNIFLNIVIKITQFVFSLRKSFEHLLTPLSYTDWILKSIYLINDRFPLYFIQLQ